MSVTYGFYNSIDNDRRYSAEDFSALFDGILRDGVFMSIGDALMVSALSGMDIIVGSGRAWFNRTWTNNDSDYLLTVETSEVLLNRIDAVVIEVNANQEVRTNSIKIIKGIPASNPVPPILASSGKLHQYPLAYIYVGSGVTEILQANITNKVGTEDCPFVTGILQTITVNALVAQWQAEFDDFMSEIDAVLDGDVATNLLGLINEHKAEDATDAHLPENVGIGTKDINLKDKLLIRPEIKDYAETLGTVSATTGTVNLDLETGNTFVLAPTGACTIAVLNPPASGKVGSFTLQIEMGTLYAITFPASFKWDDGKVPTFTANKKAVITGYTIDGGATYIVGAFGTKF